MSENNHEKVLLDLKDSITNTKLLVEKVMKMRIQCKESQMIMLRLFNPKCIKILEIPNDLLCKTLKQVNGTKKPKVKHINMKKSETSLKKLDSI